MSQLRQRILAARTNLVSELEADDEARSWPTGDPASAEPGPSADDLDDFLVPEAPPAPPEPRRSLPREVHAEIHKRVVRDLGPMLSDDSIRDDELDRHLREIITAAFLDAGMATDGAMFEQFADDIRNDVVGYGPIEELLADDTVTEVMVNGPDIVFAEREGKVVEVASGFLDAEHVRRVIDKIVSHVGRRIDESSPMVDARLPDGSRVNAIIPPLAIDGPFLTIRKFAKEP